MSKQKKSGYRFHVIKEAVIFSGLQLAGSWVIRNLTGDQHTGADFWLLHGFSNLCLILFAFRTYKLGKPAASADRNLSESLKDKEPQMGVELKLVSTPEVELKAEPTPKPICEPAPVVIPMKAPPTQLINAFEWDSLLRNAKDGGANSVLACHVLRKTAELLNEGDKQVEQMRESSNIVYQNIRDLDGIREEIHRVSSSLRMVSFNLAIEAAKADAHGRTISVVADEMNTLSRQFQMFSLEITKKLEDVRRKTAASEELTKKVAILFVNTRRELDQFKNLMLRIEELATNQGNQLKTLEDRLNSAVKTG